MKSNQIMAEIARRQVVCAPAAGRALADRGSLGTIAIAVASLETRRISMRTSRKHITLK